MRGQSAAAAAVWLLLSRRLRRAGRARRDDSFMEFYDISHESIISSSALTAAAAQGWDRT